MTDQEKQLITGLGDRIRNAPAAQVDREADELIRRTIGARQDALYILTQTVLLQEMALNQAKAQIEQLKQQGSGSGGGFLGNQAAATPAPPQSPGGGRSWGGGAYQASSYRTGAPPAQPAPVQPAPVQQQYEVVQVQPAGGGFSGFLHNAAQTAAGIVAGEVAFSALSSIFGGHGGYGGGGGFFGGGGYGVSPVSETIINNNYYEEGHGGGGGEHRGFAGDGDDRGLDPGLSPDVEDRRFAGGAGNDDTSDNTSDDRSDDSSDDSSVDDSSVDDSSGDDSSSYDDGSDSN